MEPTRTALVLGATGGIGGAIASALTRHGWQVRAMVRDVEKAGRSGHTGIDWIGGDAMQRADVVSAARGVSAIVHAVNPPDYSNWDKLVLPMIDNTIAAARAAGGARIVLPGTIYNFDPAAGPVVDADTPQQPASRKGKIRVAMEKRLQDATDDTPSLILRAGDFFGPGTRSSWFSQAMVRPGRPVRYLLDPARGPGHSWAYLPDLAETFAMLLDRTDMLRPFERLQFEGFYDESGRGMTGAIRQVVGRRVPALPFPWWTMTLAAPFGGFTREAAEIAPNWRHPLRLDNTRLVQLLGREPRTPLTQAVIASLVDMGCMAARPAIGHALA